MSEMRNISCPSCESKNQPLAAVDGIQEYRCRACGLVYYGPCGCDTTHTSVASTQVTSEAGGSSLPGDWQITTPPFDPRDRAAATAHPGCS